MKLQKFIITTLLSVSIIGTGIPANVSASSYAVTKHTYTLKINKKKQKKKAVGASYNGKTIKTKAPGYKTENTPMLSAYYVFKKGMGVSYSYSKKNWKITLKRGSNKIVMTRGNKYAYVNGKKTKMPTPARSVYSYEQKSNFIYVPGSFCAKYLRLSYSWNDSSFKSYSVKYSGGYTKIYIKPRSKTIKGFRVTQTDSYIRVYYASPKSMYKQIIVLDAGHGGSDSGAVAYGYKEKNMTLKIVQAAKKYFDKDPNIKVYYTRLSDTYPSLSDRSALANNVGADRFYSVHINSAGKSAHGTETLYNSKGYKSTSGLTSYKWSATIHPYIRSATGFTNRGLVDRTGLYVLRHSKTASTLTEIGFVSNKSESKKMNANLNKYGKAVYNSTKASLNKNPTKR